MISHPHQAIFIHIPKAGGQSIETLFLRDLGLDWANRDALSLRYNPNQAPGPKMIGHLTRREYTERHYITEDQFARYYTFTVVRHPFSRAMSFYDNLGYSSAIDLDTFVADRLPKLMQPGTRYHWFVRPQTDFLRNHDGVIDLDDVFHLEDMAQVGQSLSERFGPAFASIPHVNRKPNVSARGHWRRRLRFAWQGIGQWSRIQRQSADPARLQRVIHDYYRADYEALGYRLDPTVPPERA